MNEKKFSKFTFKPQKSLGQNFLLSSLHLTKIVKASRIDNSSNVIEIGPGYGSLTAHILEVNPQNLICIEKDPNLFSWLNSNLTFQNKKLNFLLADVLEVKWEQLVKSLDFREKSILIGNLPYNIANQLINRLVRKESLFKRLVFLVQKEVAQRWVASNVFYKSKYSSLSVILNYFCFTEMIFEVPKYLFKPQPPVDGAVVSFEFRRDLPIDFPVQKFFIFTRNCFRFRRKTLLNNLRSFCHRNWLLNDIFSKLSLDEKVRPQDLNIEQYIKLFEMI